MKLMEKDVIENRFAVRFGIILSQSSFGFWSYKLVYTTVLLLLKSPTFTHFNFH